MDHDPPAPRRPLAHLDDAVLLRARMEQSGLGIGRLARIMSLLGDRRSRAQIERQSTRQRAGQAMVSNELLCLIRALHAGWTPGEDQDPSRSPTSSPTSILTAG